MSPTNDHLKMLPFWKDLTEQQQEQAEVSAIVRHYLPGDMLYSAGSSCLGMIYILSGVLRAYILSEEGREVTLYRIGEGELGVLSASGVLSHISYETHLTAVTEADVLILPDAVYSQLTDENLALRCYTYELAVQRLSLIMWVLQQILFARFDQRLASFLLEEYRRSGSPEIHMTQEQIAEFVNSAREVVARMLKRFAADGLIENGRGYIELVNIPELRLICGNNLFPEELTEIS